MDKQEGKPEKLIAGFWIRFVADLIDMMILWTVAMVLGFFMENWFLKLGENGVWLGLAISIAYFVPTQSNIGNGQSLGKRLIGIQVLGLDGNPLPLAKSFLRYAMISIVVYAGLFESVVYSLISTRSLVMDAIMVISWLIAFAGCYLLLPLHPLKRGLHDLLAGSIVVYRHRFDAAAIAAMDNLAKTRRAIVIVACIATMTIVAVTWGYWAIPRTASLTNLRGIKTQLEANGKFHDVALTEFTSFGPGTPRSLIVSAHVDGPTNQHTNDLKPFYDLAFQAIRDQIEDLSPYANLRVGLQLGYNLGIRRHYVTLFQDENPANPGERRDASLEKSF